MAVRSDCRAISFGVLLGILSVLGAIVGVAVYLLAAVVAILEFVIRGIISAPSSFREGWNKG